MKPGRIVIVLLTVVAVSRGALAGSPLAFQPQAAVVLGTAKAGTASPFTQVITQLAGELAVSTSDELFVNLAPDWLKLARMLKDPQPVIAYTTVAWADQALQVACWLDRANSNLALGRLRIVMEVTEGTIGSIPAGTIFAISDARLIRQAGMLGLRVHNTITPGIYPDVLPTSMTMAVQIVPDLWRTGKPGEVFALNTFTSIPPPDGSPPIVTEVRQRIPVE